jgi:hypothetical protein
MVAYSIDLCERVSGAVDAGGGTQEQIAERSASRCGGLANCSRGGLRAA